MQSWTLTLAFWLHMAATVVWIGGLFFQALVLPPTLRRVAERGQVLEALRRRFQPLAWLSLAVLIGTGLTQMAANPNYTGLLSIENSWSRAILAKHLGVAFMVGVGAYQTWFVQPELARMAILEARTPQADHGPLLRRQERLSRLNLALGIAVLAFTAIARTV
ncbi:MAG: DUF4149 domain-containing protein [Anaerolineales bacterium]